MATLLLLYDNAADEGTLSGGSWAVPLTEMQDPRPTTKAQSTDLTPSSTTWKIQLTSPKTFKAIVFGPTNFSSGANYRIRGYSDAGYTSLVDDTGSMLLGSTPTPTLDMHWTDTFWWSGAQPLDDPGNAAGIWVIHVFDADVTAQYWQFDIDNSSNPDGYITIGRLYMGMAWEPSFNMDVDSNRAGFESYTTMQQAAGGTRYYNRRRAARTFEFSFGHLATEEVLEDVYRIAAISGIDKQVFVIPDPDDDTTQLSRRSILGNLSEMPAWSLSNIDLASTAFKVVESV